MNNIIVLGGGMVGSAMAIDLAKNNKVTVVDFNQAVLVKLQAKSPAIQVQALDVTKEADLKKSIEPFDMVVCAVPGFLGYQTLTWILEAQKNVVDISFFPEDALTLKSLAEAGGVTAIVDCGVAPGMSNLVLGYHNESMNIEHFECLVGGLPKVKKWPFAYKAPFSPVDVIEEYTRPARYVENGHVLTKPALSDVAHHDFDAVGTLESFNSDGLRSLLFTMGHIPNMIEKTLRYPGHVEYIQVLKSSGFFETQPIEVSTGVLVNPLDFTSKVLFDEWKLGETEEEMTVMRITVSGKNESGDKETIIYHLHDSYCADTQTSSMARTTGYTATAAVNLLLQGKFGEIGVFPPEQVSNHDGCFDFILHYLSERGVVYRKETILG
ncbi:saccharopine dehydrogenase NADP-binding domain-containing protein [Reichenbachiella carrageenanivorans]|uniref:Saccharopine dehydrogenase NADP-binding domain-containing protein n=1 Tax=Reichenbachiella carrageenanivorans TaxID=2979869 RepID=A0ABY6CWD2_9BACT|nr:saccharopine dehydrogenase C-terminal domain-containing protein [Reichenbachiella carrageenanivorans]UXX78222.1 saccharopine dehydrogenase NADP-binding domain-containing protein [Reichenbachiella carrageenanivorans]